MEFWIPCLLIVGPMLVGLARAAWLLGAPNGVARWTPMILAALVPPAAWSLGFAGLLKNSKVPWVRAQLIGVLGALFMLPILSVCMAPLIMSGDARYIGGLYVLPIAVAGTTAVWRSNRPSLVRSST